jgi:hypothetical protein
MAKSKQSKVSTETSSNVTRGSKNVIQSVTVKIGDPKPRRRRRTKPKLETIPEVPLTTTKQPLVNITQPQVIPRFVAQDLPNVPQPIRQIPNQENPIPDVPNPIENDNYVPDGPIEQIENQPIDEQQVDMARQIANDEAQEVVDDRVGPMAQALTQGLRQMYLREKDRYASLSEDIENRRVNADVPDDQDDDELDTNIEDERDERSDPDESDWDAPPDRSLRTVDLVRSQRPEDVTASSTIRPMEDVLPDPTDRVIAAEPVGMVKSVSNEHWENTLDNRTHPSITKGFILRLRQIDRHRFYRDNHFDQKEKNFLNDVFTNKPYAKGKYSGRTIGNAISKFNKYTKF